MGVERRSELLALVWGFAEATLFFVVPDVPITFFAARSRRLAVRSSVWAFAGALAGGMAMYAWGARDPATAQRVVAAVPQVGQATQERVREELERRGSLAVALGPLTATPYKVYAVEAGALGVPAAGVALMTVPSRLLRFLLAAALAGWVFGGPLASWSPARRRLGLVTFWLALYAILYLVAWS